MNSSRNVYDLSAAKSIEGEKIVGIVLRPHATTKKSFRNKTLVSSQAIGVTHITLVDNNQTKLIELPIENFINVPQEAGRFANVLVPNFNSQYSILKVADPTTVTTGQVIEITVFYESNC